MSKKDKNKKINIEPESVEDGAKAAAEAAEEILKEESKENAAEGESAKAAEKAGGSETADKTATEIAELKDRVVRQMAEFDNFRKRSEKEKSQMFDLGAKAIIEKLLPVIDNFERGLKDAPEDAFAEGIQMIYKQLVKNLSDAGVEAIECVGKEFDPNLHNAVMHEEDDSGEENIVTEEFQKGYTYKGELVRPSMVKVKN